MPEAVLEGRRVGKGYFCVANQSCQQRESHHGGIGWHVNFDVFKIGRPRLNHKTVNIAFDGGSKGTAEIHG